MFPIKHNKLTVCPVENKLLSFGQVKSLVIGNFAEVSEATHKLFDAMAGPLEVYDSTGFCRIFKGFAGF